MWFVIPGVPQPELVLSETTRTSALPVTQGSDLALRDTLITRTRGDKFAKAIGDILAQ